MKAKIQPSVSTKVLITVLKVRQTKGHPGTLPAPVGIEGTKDVLKLGWSMVMVKEGNDEHSHKH